MSESKSEWASTGKRWLPLRELVNQVPDPHNVIYVVVYRLNVDGGMGIPLYPSSEDAKSSALKMTNATELEWRLLPSNFPTWHAKSPEGMDFEVLPIYIECSQL